MASPGLAFHDWASEQKLTRTSDFTELKGIQLAIDADDYVDRILTDTSSREPLLPALGGLPMAIKKHVNNHLAVFKEFNITPHFVFNGLDIAPRERLAISQEARKTSESLNEAWTLYSQSKADAAVEEFGKSCIYRSFNVKRWLTQYLIRQGYHSIVATYSAAAQIVYWKNDLQKNADALAGSVDLFVFGAEKIITAFDWEAKSFSWTTADLIRSKLSINQDQLVDVCLISGCSLIPALDEVMESSQPAIESARSIIGRVNNDALMACGMSKNDQYLTLFKKAKAAVKHLPVIKAGGKLEPLHYAEMLDNVHDYIGRRLPDEVLYYSSRGFANPKFLNVRTQMELYEVPPLDGGNSQTYQNVIQEKLTPIRRQALAVLSHRLHRYYHRMDVSLVTWYSESSSTALGVPEAISTLSNAADQWHVPESVLQSFTQYKESDLQSSPLQSTLTLLTYDTDATKTITRASSTTLQTQSEFISNATWRFLQGRGYIDSDHKLTSWGKAYTTAMDHAKSDDFLATAPAEAEEAIFLALELVRLDLLNGTPMFTSPTYTGAPLRGTEADKYNTNLISRVCCLATFQHKDLGFTGPLSRHLLAYQQVAAAVRNSLRDLLEMYAVDMLLSAAFSRDITPQQWSQYGAYLPLLAEPNLGLALVVKSYLDELSNDPARRADITRWFPQAIDLNADLKKAWKLWEAVNAGVQAADVPTSTKSSFSTADAWLKQKLAHASTSLTNGTT